MRWKGWVGRSVPVWSLLLSLLMPVAVDAATPVRVSVVRSTGTLFLGQTIWRELNAGWSAFGNVPVELNYTALAGHDLTLAQIQATQADVLVLSAPGFNTYKMSEITAIQSYIEAGHGLIISYGTFFNNDRYLAPLVGLSQGMRLGTGFFRDGIDYDNLAPSHPVLQALANPYETGVPYMAVPSFDGLTWGIQGGQVLSEALAVSGSALGRGVIVSKETDVYRGLYFAHYPEAMSEGTNQQDMQLFYNGLLWTAGVPEPSSGLLAVVASVGWAIIRRRVITTSR